MGNRLWIKEKKKEEKRGKEWWKGEGRRGLAREEWDRVVCGVERLSDHLPARLTCSHNRTLKKPLFSKN